MYLCRGLLSIGFAGSAGAYLGGVLADRLGVRDRRWYMWLSSVSIVASVPFALGFLLLGTRGGALACFVPFYVLANMYIGPMLSMTQGLVKLRMRATASAILLFILNIIGLGAGPFIVGFLNDRLSDQFGAEAVRYSLSVVALMSVIAGVCFYLASQTLRDDMHAAET